MCYINRVIPLSSLIMDVVSDVSEGAPSVSETTKAVELKNWFLLGILYLEFHFWHRVNKYFQ